MASRHLPCTAAYIATDVHGRRARARTSHRLGGRPSLTMLRGRPDARAGAEVTPKRAGRTDSVRDVEKSNACGLRTAIGAHARCCLRPGALCSRKAPLTKVRRHAHGGGHPCGCAARRWHRLWLPSRLLVPAIPAACNGLGGLISWRRRNTVADGKFNSGCNTSNCSSQRAMRVAWLLVHIGANKAILALRAPILRSALTGGGSVTDRRSTWVATQVLLDWGFDGEFLCCNTSCFPELDPSSDADSSTAPEVCSGRPFATS